MTNNETHSESKFGPVEKVSGNLYIDEMLRNVEMFFAVADAQGPEGRLPGTREGLAMVTSGALAAAAVSAIDERRTAAEAGKFVAGLRLSEEQIRDWHFDAMDNSIFPWFRQRMADALADETYPNEVPDSQGLFDFIHDWAEKMATEVWPEQAEDKSFREDLIDEQFEQWFFTAKALFFLIERANLAQAEE